jgi:hypothetical protein
MFLRRSSEISERRRRARRIDIIDATNRISRYFVAAWLVIFVTGGLLPWMDLFVIRSLHPDWNADIRGLDAMAYTMPLGGAAGLIYSQVTREWSTRPHILGFVCGVAFMVVSYVFGELLQ